MNPPILYLQKPTSTAQWQAIAEWQQRYVSGYQMKGHITQRGQDTLDLVTRQINADRFEENQSDAKFYFLDQHFLA